MSNKINNNLIANYIIRFILYLTVLFTISYAAKRPKSEKEKFIGKLIIAAIEQTKNEVVYDPSYVPMKYPNGDIPANRGVCTDVLIRAYRKLGIDLQKEVHKDMVNNFNLYPKLWGPTKPDPNIDHRRVPNLITFFKRKGEILPISENPRDYRPGDIIVWNLGGDITHIGMVVNKKSTDRKRFKVVHNIGFGPKLEDVLFDWKIIGHYRYFGNAKIN